MKKIIIFCLFVFSFTAFSATKEVTAKGYNGDIKLQVNYEGKKIIDIKVLNSSENERIGGEAIKAVIEDIIEKQSTNVDSIAGATITSEAIKQAVGSVVK